MEIVNGEKTNMFTIIEEEKKSEDSTEIKTWVNEKILKTKFTILLISKETFDREYVSYEIQKSKENKNTFIPILMDNENNKFTKPQVKRIKDKLLSGMNCEPLRRWYEDKGEDNIVQWLNDALHVLPEKKHDKL